MKLLTLVSQELLDQLDLTGSLDVATGFDSDYSVSGEQVNLTSCNKGPRSNILYFSINLPFLNICLHIQINK